MSNRRVSMTRVTRENNMKVNRDNPLSAAIGRVAFLSAISAAAVLAACGGNDDHTLTSTPLTAAKVPNCDTASIKAAYSAADTEVLLAQPFKKDDLLKLPNSPLPDASLLKAAADVCLVKLLVKG